MPIVKLLLRCPVREKAIVLCVWEEKSMGPMESATGCGVLSREEESSTLYSTVDV